MRFGLWNAAAVGAVVMAASGPAHAGKYNVLYVFGSQANDAEMPLAGLTYSKGIFYGTTFVGGRNFHGAVFSLTPTGTEAVVHSFGKGDDGVQPMAGLIKVGGALYGTTWYGGADADGAVYSVTPGGSEKLLYSFTGAGDGAHPAADLLDVNGILYGATPEAAFSVTPTGTFALLHSFAGGSDGSDATSGLTNVNGTLYGTTSYGGSSACGAGCGTVYSLALDGTETVIYAFQGGDDGAVPSTTLVNVGGTLYGTTRLGGSGNCNVGSIAGCGTVFSLNLATGVETTIYSFQGGSDGANPAFNLTNVAGIFYGTTFHGGGTRCKSYGCGTVFSLTAGGTETILHAFGKGSDGSEPDAGLIAVGHVLYGTTSAGGTLHGGTVFSIKP